MTPLVNCKKKKVGAIIGGKNFMALDGILWINRKIFVNN